MTEVTAPTEAVDCAVHASPLETSRTEARTRAVVGLTAAMMVIELIVGYLTKSLALTADGWHMATHVGALGLTAVAYWYARTRAGQQRFAFGTGKVYALAGFTSSGMLIAVAVTMLFEGFARLVNPEVVDFSDALPVAVLGLVVNVVSALLLSVNGHGHHSHGHHHHASEHDSHLEAVPVQGARSHDVRHTHGHEGLLSRASANVGRAHDAHEHDAHEQHSHAHEVPRQGAPAHREHEHHAFEGGASANVGETHHAHGAHVAHDLDQEGHDHNLRAAYLHVVADAMTSVLAICALLAGRYLGLLWLDPVVAIVASAVILKWGFGLLGDCASQLIDISPSLELRTKVKTALESLGNTQVLDLHLWRVSPSQLACVVTVSAAGSPGSLEAYKAAVRAAAPIDHLTIEVSTQA